ncbi:acetyltransferase [Virgibacillus sp. 179-BFC.A HS]|uniref:Acetyltransferase n=1 Tax=Tigheibacillus jepli TaxID=3035914 RepID=A0ABU5CE81_9BACI|nr:acetyltransferase [Virgibacillus sp. 179-BFC.A HS]MDY0404157.1 acetyltransferase [Virgibacillus sp. 179-BFC.A HS]
MENQTCPKCNGKDIKKGSLASSFVPVQMFPEHKRGTASPISAEFCNDCGYILALYVDNPKDVK